MEDKMDKIEFEILGDPKSQKRHRSVRTGSGIRSYDPSADDKGNFIAQLIAQIPTGFKPITEPIAVYVCFDMKRPQSHFRAGKNAGILKDNAPTVHTKKPDIDNLCKLIMDSGNGILWMDDALIYSLAVRKQYGDQPKTKIIIFQGDRY